MKGFTDWNLIDGTGLRYGIHGERPDGIVVVIGSA